MQQLFYVSESALTRVLQDGHQRMSTPLAPEVPAAAATPFPPRQLPLARRVIKAILGPYMHLYHRLELEGAENVPLHGPLLILLNHASLLDVPALMVIDPYPDTVTVVKASLTKVPVVRWFVKQWNGLPVDRQGRDSSSVRAMLTLLRAGRIVTVAAEGRRSRSGRLEPINLVLARIAASANVPIMPVGIRGSFEALPPGARLPRPRQIVVRAGVPFRLARATPVAAAAERIRDEIAALLPPEMQPLDEPVSTQEDDT
jgi:1-acyl-sn-glycerol-3-phosphate acyltransferase